MAKAMSIAGMVVAGFSEVSGLTTDTNIIRIGSVIGYFALVVTLFVRPQTGLFVFGLVIALVVFLGDLALP